MINHCGKSITNHHQPSETITNHHQPSEAITNHHQPSVTITNHHQPSVTIIKHHQPSEHQPILSRWSPLFSPAWMCHAHLVTGH